MKTVTTICSQCAAEYETQPITMIMATKPLRCPACLAKAPERPYRLVARKMAGLLPDGSDFSHAALLIETALDGMI